MEVLPLSFCQINPTAHVTKAIELVAELNPGVAVDQIENRLLEMVKLPNYRCFGLFFDNELIGISSGWTTIRIYCGKQLELDNVVITSKMRSRGYGTYFLNAIKEWTLQNDYRSLGLNTYVQNSKSHKFYFNEDFKVIGFHFEQAVNSKAE